jgi:hypothetical protein
MYFIYAYSTSIVIYKCIVYLDCKQYEKTLISTNYDEICRIKGKYFRQVVLDGFIYIFSRLCKFLAQNWTLYKTVISAS